MRYVALLRGIGPGDPRMRNAELRGVLEGLGYGDVASVISSGNLLFDAGTSDARALEARIEAAWPERLGFRSTTILRTSRQLRRLVAAEPFGGREDVPTARLQATFLKRPTRVRLDLPCRPGGDHFEVVAVTGGTVCSVVDPTHPRATDLVRWLERTFGTEITTRSWRTVHRIADRLSA